MASGGKTKNITLIADAALIERATAVARTRGKSLNQAFREWLLEFAGDTDSANQFDVLMEELRYVNSGRRFSREESNRR